jgi:hypothetical protein
MRRSVRILLYIALGIVALIVGAVLFYKGVFPTYTYRYRMTVEVTVDGVVHSGSSVIEVRLVRQPQVLSGVPRVRAELTGEAVFVDLGKGRNVIALLASGPNGSNVDYPSYLVSKHFRLSMWDDWDLAKYSELRGRWDLPANQLPTFVTFADLNDPKSARVVSLNEFKRVFGPDVHLKRVEIEMTNAPVTLELEAKLPWWASSRRPAAVALRAAHLTTGSSIDAESAFVRR